MRLPLPKTRHLLLPLLGAASLLLAACGGGEDAPAAPAPESRPAAAAIEPRAPSDPACGKAPACAPKAAGPVTATPLARRLARARGIDLASVTGTGPRGRVQARDVSLALSRHDDSSLLNLLPATLTDLEPLAGGQVQARLDACGTPLLARISHRSVERLQLRPGMPVWAQIKAVALLV